MSVKNSHKNETNQFLGLVIEWLQFLSFGHMTGENQE